MFIFTSCVASLQQNRITNFPIVIGEPLS